MDEVWTRIDKNQLAELVAAKVADSVVRAYTERPAFGGPLPEQKALHARILEIVAQTLGQRVIDQMDVQLQLADKANRVFAGRRRHPLLPHVIADEVLP